MPPCPAPSTVFKVHYKTQFLNVLWLGNKVMGFILTFFYTCCLSGSLKANSSHGLIYFSTWSPFAGTVWGELGDVVLLGKVCNCEWTLRFQKTHVNSSVLSVWICVSRCKRSATLQHCTHLTEAILLTWWSWPLIL